MNKKEITNMFKNNVIDWYDFKENTSVFNYYDVDEIKENYDYIIIHEKLTLIEKALEHLNQNGTIILLINNKFGISNFITENGLEKNAISYSKCEIEHKLKELNLDFKFFYPLPNNQITNAVFSDDYLPTINDTKINNNNLYDEMVFINEIELIKKIIKAGKFTDFTNSYFVEVNPKTKIKFASFNNLRNEQYRLCTRIYDEYVEKIPTNEKALEHINNMKSNIENMSNLGFNVIDKYEDGKIVSPYIREKAFYQILLEKICENQVEDAIFMINEWYNYIDSKLADNLIKYIDLTFENTFYINNEYVFFDQEWVEENIPNKFILYRAINNLYTYNSEINKIISKEDMLKEFGLIEQEKEFNQLESKIQGNKIDKELCELYNDYSLLPNVLGDFTKEMERLGKADTELNNIISNLREQIAQKDDLIKYYENMKLVKLTNKLRKNNNKHLT